MNIFKKYELNRAFTLIELLVVISIIGFLSSVVLASMQTARDKAITAKITEDLRQVKIAAELAYGDNGNYIFIVANPNESILADSEIFLTEDSSDFFIKTANAQTVPPACALFNSIVSGFVTKKYIASVPVHPKQNYAKEICYKAATSTDGSYFSAFAETPAEFDLSGTTVSKSVGFVVGDTSAQTLNAIRNSSRRTNGGEVTFLRNSNNNGDDIASITDSVDEVIGVTSGAVARYGSVITPPSPYTCPDGQVYLQNGLQNTENGTCSPIVYCTAVVGATYDPVTNTCIGGNETIDL